MKLFVGLNDQFLLLCTVPEMIVRPLVKCSLHDATLKLEQLNLMNNHSEQADYLETEAESPLCGESTRGASSMNSSAARSNS